MLPHDTTFAPLESAINYTIAQPNTPYTQINHQEWLKADFHEGVAQAKSNLETVSKTLQEQNAAVFSIETSLLRRSSANSITIASSATTLQDDTPAPEYFQPYLIKPPLQLLHGGVTTRDASISQAKTLNTVLAPSRAS
jgi:hypothetical protein